MGKIADFQYSPDSCKFRTWLYRIVRNKVIDHIRKANTKKNKKVEIPDADTHSSPEIYDIAEKSGVLTYPIAPSIISKINF